MVFSSAERCFTQFLIEMVVNKCCVHFWAACQLLQVGVMGRPEATYVRTVCVVGLCKVGVLYLSSIKYSHTLAKWKLSVQRFGGIQLYFL